MSGRGGRGNRNNRRGNNGHQQGQGPQGGAGYRAPAGGQAQQQPAAAPGPRAPAWGDAGQRQPAGPGGAPAWGVAGQQQPAAAPAGPARQAWGVAAQQQQQQQQQQPAQPREEPQQQASGEARAAGQVSGPPPAQAGPGGDRAPAAAVPVAEVERGSGLNVEEQKVAFDEEYDHNPPVLCTRTAAAGRRPGRTIDVEVNMFPITLPTGSVQHYDVEVDSLRQVKGEKSIPEQKRARCASTVINRMVMREFAHQYQKELGNGIPAYDGRKNVYFKKSLPKNVTGKAFSVKLQYNGEDCEFIVQLKHVGTVSFNELHGMYDGQSSKGLFQSAIVASDIILRAGPTLSFVPVGRSFFTQEREPVPGFNLSGGLEAFTGFYTSIRLGQWKPLVNFDTNTTAFYKTVNLIDYIKETFGDRCLRNGLDNQTRIKLQKHLFGVRVNHSHLHQDRRHRIEGISHKAANAEFFNQGDNSISVSKYFMDRYKIKLRYPHLPCVVERRGSKVPLELCTIATGQHCRRKLSEMQTANMIRTACMTPSVRFQKLLEGAKKTQSTAAQYMNEFGMSFATKPVTVKARVLDPPKLSYEQDVLPQAGQWNNGRFIKPATLTKWAIAVHTPGQQFTDYYENKLVQLLMSKAQSLGIKMAQPKITYHNQSERQMLEEVKQDVKDVEMTMVVLGSRTRYAVLKSEAETSDLGMRTQCVKENNVTNDRKFNATFAENLLLKMNAKAGGSNWRISTAIRPPQMCRPYMVVGADVNHSGPGDTVTPSVAALVASLDPMPARYYATTSVQTKGPNQNRVEYIVDLENMFFECLQAFQTNAKGRLPETIYFYRDGVSEGQLDPVRYHEMTALRRACKRMREGYKPPMTFIVVQKRHHVRFRFPGRDGNVPPGTVVDSDVVHPMFLDFYLASQKGAMGTSVPAHYHVVHDDASHSLDEIQQISYYLCHVHARCTKSVSIPAPVYYAHLAAARAKDHIKGRMYEGGDHSIMSGSSGDAARPIEEYASAQRVVPTMKNEMYFV